MPDQLIAIICVLAPPIVSFFVIGFRSQNEQQVTPNQLQQSVPKQDIYPKSYNGIPYAEAPSKLIPQMDADVKTPKTDTKAVVISSSVPNIYNSPIDRAIKSGKKYASWTMQTGLTIAGPHGGLTITMVSPVYANDPHHKWERAYRFTFESVIMAINYAINHQYDSIEIGYDYDGVWQYAGGYWRPTTQSSQKYINELNKITKTNPNFIILFTKIDSVPQHRFSKIIRHTTKKLK